MHVCPGSHNSSSVAPVVVVLDMDDSVAALVVVVGIDSIVRIGGGIHMALQPPQ